MQIHDAYGHSPLVHDVDTSRHYQPLLMIKKVIDSMSYAKLVRNLEVASFLHVSFSDIYSEITGIELGGA